VRAGRRRFLLDAASRPFDTFSIKAMKNRCRSRFAVVLLTGACAALLPAVGDAADPVLARVEQVTITQDQLLAPLIDAYGLDVLLKVVQLELARQDAAARGVRVTETDVETELQMTLRQLMPEGVAGEQDQILQQLLQQQRVSRTEFDLVMRTNAHLRAIAMPIVNRQLNDETLRKAFNAMYGEKVRVRRISLDNLQEVAAVQKRLAAGEDFAKLAMQVSKDADTRPLGGELQPFTRNARGVGMAFIDAAFALQVGQVSEPVQDGGLYHLVKLEERIAPRTVKFEDVKDSVREEVATRLAQDQMVAMRQEINQRALRSLKIENPVLRKQYEQRVAAANARAVEKSEVIRQLDARHQREEAPPATQPSSR
jgi:foldase protein PrsA